MMKALREREHTAECQHPFGLEPGEPEGYVEWHQWVLAKVEHYEQRQCPHCRLWVVWVPLEEEDAA